MLKGKKYHLSPLEMAHSMTAHDCAHPVEDSQENSHDSKQNKPQKASPSHRYAHIVQLRKDGFILIISGSQIP